MVWMLIKILIIFCVIVTWPPIDTNITTPGDVVVVENCEFTGLCQTLLPGGRTVPIEETTEDMIETTTEDMIETTTNENENIPTPARLFQ